MQLTPCRSHMDSWYEQRLTRAWGRATVGRGDACRQHYNRLINFDRSLQDIRTVSLIPLAGEFSQQPPTADGGRDDQYHG